MSPLAQKTAAPSMERSAHDYAIEFAGYLADAATAHLQFMDSSCKLPTAVDRAGFSYQAAVLKSAIYEFANGAPIAPNKDAAIALARKLAAKATGYLELVGRCFVKTVDHDGLGDHYSGLRSAVYEFEKRAARAEKPPADPVVVQPWLNGKPYYCALCGAGGPERMACEMPDCTLESEAAAIARRDRESAFDAALATGADPVDAVIAARKQHPVGSAES